MKKDGVNGLTRGELLSTGVDGLTSFDAGGMIGTVDIKNKVPTPCSMITQLQKGKFVRMAPKKKGTFDCNKRNAVQHQGRPDQDSRRRPVSTAPRLTFLRACPSGTWPGASPGTSRPLRGGRRSRR